MSDKEEKYVPYQKCPVCDGIGQVWVNPVIDPAMSTFISPHYEDCTVCHGSKIIPMYRVE